jgi:hypothetical protein
VPRACARRDLDELLRLVLVPLGAPGEVQDDLGARERGVDAVARRQVAHDELDAGLGRPVRPRQHARGALAGPQPGDDAAAERPRAAGDENPMGRSVVHASSGSLSHRRARTGHACMTGRKRGT